MKKHESIKKFILLMVMLTVIIDGLFLGTRESIELSDNYNLESVGTQTHSAPMRSDVLIKANDLCIISVAEVRGVNAVSEAIRKIEKNSYTKSIVILSLILCILMSEGALFTAVLPSIFPWTDIILSRRRIIYYIKRQDGAK